MALLPIGVKEPSATGRCHDQRQCATLLFAQHLERRPDSPSDLTICYDLRFPELYRALALAGAQILTVPANFTERTGRDHWEVLLRARAIENGAYVLAPAQIGDPPGQPAYGHTMAIDPWGIVIAQAADGVGIIRADIETDCVTAVRRQIPVLANRRPEVYSGYRASGRRQAAVT